MGEQLVSAGLVAGAACGDQSQYGKDRGNADGLGNSSSSDRDEMKRAITLCAQCEQRIENPVIWYGCLAFCNAKCMGEFELEQKNEQELEQANEET